VIEKKKNTIFLWTLAGLLTISSAMAILTIYVRLKIMPHMEEVQKKALNAPAGKPEIIDIVVDNSGFIPSDKIVSVHLKVLPLHPCTSMSVKSSTYGEISLFGQKEMIFKDCSKADVDLAVKMEKDRSGYIIVNARYVGEGTTWDANRTILYYTSEKKGEQPEVKKSLPVKL